MMELLKSELGRLRIIAFVEGVSYLVILLVTMPLKYGLDMLMPNKVVGMGHGLLFMLYILAVVMITFNQNWSMKKMSLALLMSIIPFGTFWADKKLFRSEG